MKSERILNLPGTINFRELGGYINKNNQKIKWHKILRSGELTNLDNYAIQELSDYGLKFDIDLRSPSEVKWNPDKIPNQTIFRSYPVYPIQAGEYSDLPSNIKLKNYYYQQTMYDPYLVMVFSEHSRIAFRQLFIDLISNSGKDQSLLFHCAAGKDRTGVAGMLIMAALEIPYQTIRDDYLLTNLVYSQRDTEKIRQQIQNDHADDFIKKMNQTFSVAATSLDRTYKLVQHQFGNWENYFSETLEISQNDLNDLRKIYLE